tara:strand:- start:257 stop:715 length:459 start_codon:yes stop_codon:yes gene_type:complete
MPEKMTKEESRVQRAIEAARIAKQMLEATGSAFGIPDAEEVKVKRPKAEKDNTKPKKTEGTHSGYGSAGDEDEYKIKKASTEHKIVNNYIMFVNNTNGPDLVSAIFGEPYNDMEDHRKQYVQKFMGAGMRLWGMLDSDKQQVLVDAAMSKYG